MDESSSNETTRRDGIAVIRWQNSPLRYAIDDVARAARARLDNDFAIGSNRATGSIVGAAERLAELLDDIDHERRDGLGYPLDETL